MPLAPLKANSNLPIARTARNTMKARSSVRMILRSKGGHSNARNELTLARANASKAAISDRISCPAFSFAPDLRARAKTLRIKPNHHHL